MRIHLTLGICLMFISTFSQTKNTFLYTDKNINNKLELLNSDSIVKYLGNQTGKLITDDGPSRVVFLNSNKTECLTMYHLAGANENSFNLFEVQKCNYKLGNFSKSNFETFTTDGGVKLGISIADLIRLKGKNYEKAEEKGLVIFKYKINDETDSFLKDYNMPSYIGEYYFKKGKLIRFKFGFPNL